jgi:uncharacterized protein (DUF433 family)
MATAHKVAFEYIVKERDYCSGKAAIGATRVRVNNVVYLHKQGKTADEIRVEYPDLTHAQIYAALAYYHDHKDEIEAELAEDEGADERYEQGKAKALADRGGLPKGRSPSGPCVGYMRAYQDLIRATVAPGAPWYALAKQLNQSRPRRGVREEVLPPSRRPCRGTGRDRDELATAWRTSWGSRGSTRTSTG